MKSGQGLVDIRDWRRVVVACLVFVPLVALASGCTTGLHEYIDNGFKVGPNFQSPPAPLAHNWIDENDPHVRYGNPNLMCWWEVFDDPVLNRLIQNAYSRNLTVRAAAYQILQAQDQRQIAVGQLFPQTQDLRAQWTRTMLTENGAAQGAGFDRYVSNLSTSFNASWELDFWGLFRRAIESADATLDQSIENYDQLVVILLANVATQYVQIRTLQRRLELARRNVAMQEPLVEQFAKRYQAGTANSAPGYFQLRSNLDNTKALIPPLETALRQANNQLCILLGIPVRDLLPELGDGRSVDPQTGQARGVHIPQPQDQAVVVGIPAELLLARPDVQAAQAQLRAQSAQIGVAEAELYPHLGFNGTIGLAATSVSRLFNGRSWTGSIGPSMTWNILNYGRLLGTVRLQDHVYQQLVAQYQNSVLNANQDVENALVAYIQSIEQAKWLRSSAEDATNVTSYLIRQFNAGFLPPGAADTGSFINTVFTTTNFLVSQQDAAAQAEGNIALNLILLYRAMGGGWQIRCRQNCLPNGGASLDLDAVTGPPTNAAPTLPMPAIELPAPTPITPPRPGSP